MDGAGRYSAVERHHACMCSDGHCISLAVSLSLAAEDLAGCFKTDEVIVLEVSDHFLAGGIRMFGKDGNAIVQEGTASSRPSTRSCMQ